MKILHKRTGFVCVPNMGKELSGSIVLGDSVDGTTMFVGDSLVGDVPVAFGASVAT